MPLEDKVDLLVEKFGTLETKFGTLETKFGTLETKFGTLETRMDSIGKKLDALDTKVTGIDAKVNKLQIGLDETKQIAKLGLEAVEGLRETTDNRFTDMSRQHVEQTDLLKSVLVHVRERVERLEPPKARRRRS